MVPATREKTHDFGPEWQPEPCRALVIIAAAIFGWVAGLLTGILFRHQTRRRVELE